jgi:serine/threonine-protein kinase RIM15
MAEEDNKSIGTMMVSPPSLSVSPATQVPEAAPIVRQLRIEDGGMMERSLSQDMREERQDLREAAEQTLNVIMDLGLDGVVRWVSPSWVDVIGTPPDSVTGRPIEELLLGENKGIFREVVESMQKDDSRSQIIRFSLQLGPASKLLPVRDEEMEDVVTPQALKREHEIPSIDLEAQGIMVYDRSSGGESHVSEPSHSRVLS